MKQQLSTEELNDIAEDYNELCLWLHNYDEEIGVSRKLREELHDMVYKRLKP